MDLKDKYHGCLIGGAVGDALGYAVEFLNETQIFERYGSSGITEYNLTNGIAQISDDTQMTLFTANGLLSGATIGKMKNENIVYSDYIELAYKDWLRTQISNQINIDEPQHTWLCCVDELYSSRAPGHSCINALMHGVKGTIEKPVNGSKGCGGIMRVAPIGLYFRNNTIENVDMIAAQAAAITHGHKLGYIPASAFVHIINILSHNTDITIEDAVIDSLKTMYKLFDDSEELSLFDNLVKMAVRLSKSEIDDLEAIHQLGEGWVAEETLAIAVYCSLKYSNDFEKAIVAAVNHNGDSDSTGAVTGNIIGAYLGINAIKNKFTNKLELKDVIIEMSDDLLSDCPINSNGECYDAVWKQKYVKNKYK